MRKFWESAGGQLVVALAVVIAIIDIAWLHSPPLGYRQPIEQAEHSGGPQQKPSHQQRNASRPPAAVNQIPTDSQEREHPAKTTATNQQPGDSEKNWRDWLNVSFAGAVAVFTLALVVIGALQARRLRQTVEVTNISANAAKRSADAAMGVALPRFIITDVTFNEMGRPLGLTLLHCQLEIRLTNYGSTPAHIIEDCLVFRVCPALDPKPRYPLHSRTLVDFGPAIKTQESYVVRRTPSLSEAQVNEIATMSDILWIYGFVKYRDFLDKVWTMGFCMSVLPELPHSTATVAPAGRFVQKGPASYTYTRHDDAAT